MSTDADFNDRAAAALAAEEGVGWEVARRYVAALRKAGVLKAGTDVKRMKIGIARDAPASVDIRLENGFWVTGELAAPKWTGVWANPFLEDHVEAGGPRA